MQTMDYPTQVDFHSWNEQWLQKLLLEPVGIHLVADLGSSAIGVEDLELELRSLWSNSRPPGEVLDHCSKQPCHICRGEREGGNVAG